MDQEQRISIPEGHVHVWHVQPEGLGADHALVQAERFLSEKERARADRFRVDHARSEYRTARALLRTVLSKYEPTPPEDWRFQLGEHGKPFIEPALKSQLAFNLSHTKGLIVCAVSANTDVGIDVEDHRRHESATRLARRVLSPREYERWMGLSEAERIVAFFEVWTLKEAYLKARGLGFALPLQGITFEVSPQVHVAFDHRIEDDPRQWSFHLQPFSEHHSLAVCLHRQAGLEVQLRPWQA